MNYGDHMNRGANEHGDCKGWGTFDVAWFGSGQAEEVDHFLLLEYIICLHRVNRRRGGIIATHLLCTVREKHLKQNKLSLRTIYENNYL